MPVKNKYNQRFGFFPRSFIVENPWKKELFLIKQTNRTRFYDIKCYVEPTKKCMAVANNK